MQVILLEKIRNLGNLGDTVNVKSGYGRNFLIPQGKAVTANETNIAVFEAKRAEFEAQSKARIESAEKRAAELVALSEITIEALASDEGNLYGSIGPADIADAMKNAGFDLSKREVNMPLGPIHNIGEHEVNVILHTDVNVTLTVKVKEAKA
jgi:large subunit ribosomal protein L9